MHDASTSIERTHELVTLGVEVDSSSGMRRTLLCDPLTGLVSYPSFEEHLTRELPRLARRELHLAIGDVDDLKEFVTARRDCDPMMFGHLAGNDCMRKVGAATPRVGATRGGGVAVRHLRDVRRR